MREILLSAREIEKEFPSRHEKEQVLKGVDVDIYKGDLYGGGVESPDSPERKRSEHPDGHS